MDKDTVTVGFIGYGNMARAIAQGFVRSGALTGEQLCACAKNWDKLCRSAQEDGIQACENAQEVAQRADIIILAVKPYLLESVTAPILPLLQKKVVVSVAAGYLFADFERFLAPGTQHVSTMPNTPVSVGEGVVLFESRHSLSEESCAVVKALFSQIALVQEIDSALFGIAGTITGCGPAFASMFLEALGDAGVKHGLPRTLAYKLAGQMLTGTGKLLVETGSHPAAMKDAVCSPAGTTIRGVAELERHGLRAAVIDAVDVIQQK